MCAQDKTWWHPPGTSVLGWKISEFKASLGPSKLDVVGHDFCCLLSQDLMQPRLASNWLCSRQWLQTPDVTPPPKCCDSGLQLQCRLASSIPVTPALEFEARLDYTPKIKHLLTCPKQSFVPPGVQTKKQPWFPVLCVCFETGSQYVAKVILELILESRLSGTPGFCHFTRSGPPHSASCLCCC